MAKKTKIYDGRTLKELLESYPDSQMVKIGTDGGGAYFLAGKAGFVLRTLNENEPIVKKSWETRVATSERNIRDAARLAPTYGEWLFNIIVRQFDRLDKLSAIGISYDDYLADIRRYHIKLIKRGVTVEKYRKILANYTPIATRTVIETRTSDITVDPGCYIVMIEGAEIGTLWMLEEMSRDKTLYLRAENDPEEEEAEDAADV